MAFQNKDFWMAKCPGSLSEGDMVYDNSSRIEPKRSHQWFMDGTEAELFPNKKQAVEIPNHSSFSGFLNSNVSHWGNGSSFHSVADQFTERLFDPEATRTFNFDDRNVPSVGIGNTNMERTDIENSFGSGSSFGLSISHTLDDPISGLYMSGIRNDKACQVKDAADFMSVSLGHAYPRDDNNTVSAHTYIKANDNPISMGLSFNRDNENMMSMGDAFNRNDNNFISMGQPFNKENNSDLSISHNYKENNSVVSMGQFLCKNENNNTTMDQAFGSDDENTVLMSRTIFQSDSAISMGQPFREDKSSITSVAPAFHKEADETISMGQSNKANDSNISMGHNYIEGNNSLSMSQYFGKGKSRIISFGGDFNDGNDLSSSGRLMCSYDLLNGPSSVQISESLSEKELLESNTDALVCAAQTASRETVSKDGKKATKKTPPNNFPSNVRSLLSTGILDGVPVKYMAWSREKELCGIIKGSGYLCGCQSCNYSKVINAYEFERHAGCKTKHPNNHIYFENGKTIYGIVQELRNTPQNLLFEVIQTITGSPINEKSFCLWKESFLAATRELQRIYGKEEGKQLA